MSEQLKDLHTQRDLIKRHLTWLDTQIANAEGSVDQGAAVAATNSAPKVPMSPVAPASEIDEERQLTSGTSDVRRAQVGCFLFFVGGILLFLFFLFGLPYLID